VPFTRATTATRTNAAGLIEVVPYNLLQYSEQFDNANWVKLNGSTLTPNTTVAPNGTLTADTFQASNLAFGGILRSSITANIGTVYTFSFYAKKNNYRYVGIRFNTSVNGQRFPNYDFDTDTLNKQGVTCDLIRELLPNGWVRLVLTFTSISGGGCDIGITTANGDTATALTGTEKVELWGAQAVEGTSALPYQLTQTRLNRPRVDFSLGGCPNLLLEPQRTNLALWSEQFDNASWQKNNTSASANSTTSPSGLVNADTLTADGTSNLHQLQQSPISVISGTNYTCSIYAKKGTNNFIQILLGSGTFGTNVWANFDLNNGVLGSVGSSTTASIQSVGDGWYRCVITGAATSTSPNGAFGCLIVTSESAVRAEVNTLSTSVFLWGAQFELGAYPTTYIPTQAASVTRNADSFQLSNVFTNNMISSAGGTWFVDLSNNSVLTRSNVSNGLFLSSTSTGIGDTLGFQSTGGAVRMSVFRRISGAFAILFTLTTDNAKVAIKWNGTTADVFVDGVKVVTATPFTTTALEFLIGSAQDVPKYINSMALYNTPLSDDECIAKTL
jgi:hypothetical protein